MNLLRIATLIAGAAALTSSSVIGAEARSPSLASLPPEVRRVVFLGDSITHGGGYVALVEAYFVTRYPQRRIEFLNLGLSSETVSGLSEPDHANGKFPRPDLHERLGRVLAQTRPDLVFACYGMNDGIYLPFDAERFARFKDGIARLRAAVSAAGAKIIHLTPPVFDELHGRHPGYAAVLDRYADWLLEQRERAGWSAIDLHRPMEAAIEAGRRSDPKFTFARDSVHPDERGHVVMARALLEGLGARDVEGAADAAALLSVHPRGKEILALVRDRQTLMKLAWLTATGHKRPGVKPGLPLEEAQAKAAALDERIAALIR